MEIKQIRYFMWVYEEGSFSRAAQKARVAQPVLSMQIRRLEQELGSPLFERHARGVKATHFGHKLYSRGVTIVKQINLIEDDFLPKSEERLSGRVHVGLSGMFNRRALKKALLPFMERYPAVDVVVSEGYTGTLVEWARDGIVDFALGAKPQFEGSLVQRLIFSDRVVLVSGRPVCGPTFTKCDLTDAKDLKLILPTTKHSFGKTCHDYLNQGVINVGRISEINSTVGSVEIAMNSDWAVMASSIAIIEDLDTPGIFIYPVTNPHIGFDLYLVYDRRRPLTPAARKFVSMLEGVFAEVRELWKGHPLWR